MILEKLTKQQAYQLYLENKDRVLKEKNESFNLELESKKKLILDKIRSNSIQGYTYLDYNTYLVSDELVYELIDYFKSLGYLVSKTYAISSIINIRIFWGEKTLWNKIKYLLF